MGKTIDIEIHSIQQEMGIDTDEKGNIRFITKARKVKDKEKENGSTHS